ncbi:MAG: YwaF family protein [Clostridia bacterium]|nr:YwaF family protein [Clostridia bacterium]
MPASSFFNNDLFHFKHIVLMAVSLIIIIVGTILTRKFKLKTMYRILMAVGIVSETVKVFSYVLMNEDKLGGYLPKTDLPFHLCSIQLIFIFILNVSGNEKIRRILHAFMYPTCLIGGVMALIIATSSSRSNWFITVQYFTYHSAIIIFALYLLMHERFTVKDYTRCLVFLAFIGMTAIYVNSILYDGASDINFMYVIHPPIDGIPFFNTSNGWLVYMVEYAIIATLAVTACYIKPVFRAIFRLDRKPSAETAA